MSARSMIRARARDGERRERRALRRRTQAGIATAAALGAVAMAAPAADASNFTVESKLDNGDKVCDVTCTLRDAILTANANPGSDTVTFAPGLSGTITLTNGELLVNSPMDIVGPGVDRVRISGDANRDNSPDSDDSRVFYVDADTYGDPNDPVTISGLTMREGYANGIGGAIYARSTNLTLDGVVMTDNAADGEGGALYANNTAVTITDSAIRENYSADDGGAMYIDDDGGSNGTTSPLVIRDTTIADNYANDEAGGAYVDDSTDSVLIERTAIVDNVAGHNAGGLMIYGPELSRAKVQDSTISGNSADGTGGGVYVNDVYDVGAEFDNSTIAGNVATNDGGGIYSEADEARVNLSSTIVADNLGQVDTPNDLDQGFAGPGFGFAFSLIESPGDAVFDESPPGSNLLGIDPRLEPLTGNGGPTPTQLIAPTSPAVDAGVANDLPVDQRGLARTQEQPGADRPGSDGTDIGAVEIPDTVLDTPSVSARSAKGKKVRVAIRASAAEIVSIDAAGSIKKAALKPAHAVTDPGTPATLTLKPRKKRAAAKIAALLGAGRKARARIDVRLTDLAGNTATERVAVTLKGARKGNR